MSLPPGLRLGVYEVVSLLGAGGIGEVYRARDPRLNRDVAIKVLPGHAVASPELLQRFELEARAAAALNHPNIVAVYDIGSHDGSPYIVSELLEGETLRVRLIRGALNHATALDIAVQVTRGLAAAHDKGITHRDLKPENIFITSDGQVKILDFGLAKLVTGAKVDGSDADTMASPTIPGTVLGTVGYMSPEQVRGEPTDQRSDIFSFGAVLYELVAGHRAFGGSSSVDTIAAVLRDDPPDPAAADAAMPGIGQVVRRCLEKSPSARFQSAKDLGFALSQLAGGIAHPSTGPAAVPSTGPAPRVPPWVRWAAVAGAAVVLAGVVAALRSRAPSVAANPTTNAAANAAANAAGKVESLVVLPLRNLSNDTEQEYFADGMTESLIGDLARLSGLRVISRTTAMSFKKSTDPLPAVAAQLGVDAVVEGSVVRSGNRVRITVRLVDARRDHSIWSETYDRDLRDVLSLQAEVARSIARQIQLTLSPVEQARLNIVPVVDPQAHEDYLRGRYFLAKGTEASLDQAIASFNRAIQRDPGHARAYAGLADAYTALRSTYRPPHVVMPKAKAAAAKALEKDPGLAEAHVSMGGVLLYYDFDWQGAGQHLLRAIELSPNLAEAHDTYAMYLAASGLHDQARAESAKAVRLDPLSLSILVDAGWMRYLARDFDGMIDFDRRALDLDRNYWPAHRDLGLGYEKVGRFADAVASLETARKLDPNPSILEMLGSAYAAAGRPDDARRVLAEMTERSARSYVCPYEVATVHAALGDTASTLEWLNKGVDERADCMPWAQSDAKLDSVRGTPEFDAMLARMGVKR